ncbi:MaoC family dehydratase [Halorientalis brevis]|uniref:MaoC family dehydratase n=1 Tax=Halorientalis brevis TaxID=1126241 RepID=A0ABD6C7F3_9EURY|nr:MaoC family dehydratase [Halorientalis brevis]
MLLNTLTDSSTHLRASLVEANRALLAASGLSTSTQDGDAPADEIEPAADLPNWDVTTDVDDPDELTVGDSVRFGKTISDADVTQFAAVSGDTNPLHLDEAAASDTMFGTRIAHGILVSGLISAALARLPGRVVYLSQDLEFHSPVYLGAQVTADCTVVEPISDDRYRLSTTVTDEDGTVIDGEAVVLVQPGTERDDER